MPSYHIPHFGISDRCEYEFSAGELLRLKRFVEGVSAVLETAYVRKDLYRSPWTISGSPEQSILMDEWTSVLASFRPLFMQNEDYNFQKTLELATRLPIRGPEPLISEMRQLLTEFSSVLNDQFANEGDIPLIHNGRTYTRWRMLKIWGYAYLWHWGPRRIRVAERLGIVRDDPAFRASCASAIIAKIGAAEALAALAKDILFWTANPDADTASYANQAKARTREPQVHERNYTRTFATFKRAGLRVLGEGNWLSLGLVTGDLSVDYIEKIDRTYVRGFHYRTGSTTEATRGLLKLSLLNPRWVQHQAEVEGTRKVVVHSSAGHRLRADVLSTKVEMAFDGPSEITFELLHQNSEILINMGPLDETFYDIP